jgi:hypothetical protein
VSTFSHKDIGRLDVPVDDAFRVGSIERVGNLDRQTDEYIHLHGLSGDPMLQRRAVQKLHDQERMAVVLPDLIDRADVGMVEGRSSLSFSLETS